MMVKLVIFLLPLSCSYVMCAVIRADGDSCPLMCPAIYAPVCGSNGKTYDNHCKFHRAHCMDSTLSFVSQGSCVDVAVRGIICTTPFCWPDYKPVCGSDGRTYNNECELNNGMCTNEYLKVEHIGTCN